MSSTIPEVEDGKGKPKGTRELTWAVFCNWARRPASRGFVVGAASVAVALVLGAPEEGRRYSAEASALSEKQNSP